MKFINRIKTIRLFKKILKKVKTNQLEESDIEKLFLSLNKLKGTTITDDYFKDIDVLFYIIGKAKDVSSGRWVNLSSTELSDRNSYNKMKDVVDELDANTIIHHKISGIGGTVSFELTYKDNFNKLMCLKLKNKVDQLKFLKSTKRVNRFLNTIIERIDQIIMGVLIGVIVYLLSTYVLPQIV